MPKPKDQYYEAALAYAHTHGFVGSSLPHYAEGERISRTCPLARAIPGAVVGCDTIIIQGKVEQLPKEVSRFIELADKGKLKHLVGDPRATWRRKWDMP